MIIPFKKKNENNINFRVSDVHPSDKRLKANDFMVKKLSLKSKAQVTNSTNNVDKSDRCNPNYLKRNRDSEPNIHINADKSCYNEDAGNILNKIIPCGSDSCDKDTPVNFSTNHCPCDVQSIRNVTNRPVDEDSSIILKRQIYRNSCVEDGDKNEEQEDERAPSGKRSPDVAFDFNHIVQTPRHDGVNMNEIESIISTRSTPPIKSGTDHCNTFYDFDCISLSNEMNLSCNGNQSPLNTNRIVRDKGNGNKISDHNRTCPKKMLSASASHSEIFLPTFEEVNLPTLPQHQEYEELDDISHVTKSNIEKYTKKYVKDHHLSNKIVPKPCDCGEGNEKLFIPTKFHRNQSLNSSELLLSDRPECNSCLATRTNTDEHQSPSILIASNDTFSTNNKPITAAAYIGDIKSISQIPLPQPVFLSVQNNYCNLQYADGTAEKENEKVFHEFILSYKKVGPMTRSEANLYMIYHYGVGLDTAKPVPQKTT